MPLCVVAAAPLNHRERGGMMARHTGFGIQQGSSPVLETAEIPARISGQELVSGTVLL